MPSNHLRDRGTGAVPRERQSTSAQQQRRCGQKNETRDDEMMEIAGSNLHPWEIMNDDVLVQDVDVQFCK